MTLPALRSALRAEANPAHVPNVERFFKTAPGQYSEGDKFLGIKVPVLRRIARQFKQLPQDDAWELLTSEYHEERLLALMLLVRIFEKADAKTRKTIYTRYLANATRVNNWDLVDSSAPQIVGRYLCESGDLAPLRKLAKSKNLWERRIAIVSTQAFTRDGQLGAAVEMAGLLLNDDQDLIHKASGWMLREVADRDLRRAEAFLKEHCRTMPRTMLRYAIEKFPEDKRQKYLAGRP